ncbi:MAG: acetyl-CoA carboxylase biotin carboxylase subunit [Acidobacteria bacterium]|nr:MAG: acetyl-CoA carboxylase biotin carboxylase subunit [Acidobacteriota bacterium]
MFTKILIANRGEIAVRVIRACREMGISTVAVYSDADRGSLHVRMADEAYAIGPSPSRESYLVIEKIIDAAKRAKAGAVHPGYGFLAENAAFAKACEEAGITFIGPSPESIALMGSKVESRRAVAQYGVEMVPGTLDPIVSDEEARKIAWAIGYPIMLKASAGGGGKGLRLVRSEDELESALRNTRSEALRAFGDAAIYIEKFVDRPRHVEIQVLADRQGNAVYVGERECTIQRRHQKVIEECPSPIMDADLRRRMGEAALKVARAASYYNAGTVEFLVDPHRRFYFLEMNTRLQVEHPITEMVTGLDLVKRQIRIAAGESLGLAQDGIVMRGAAIECRVYAEDPSNNFFPSPGRITSLRTPSGPGIRDDGGVYPGWTVPMDYDPLISKLVAWGATRDEAIVRMKRALGEYHIEGIKTNIPFFLEMLDHPDFQRGDFDTGFIDRWLQTRTPPLLLSTVDQDLALLAASLFHSERSGSRSEAGKGQESRWKVDGRRRGLRSS